MAMARQPLPDRRCASTHASGEFQAMSIAPDSSPSF
jgi:hypothetical protein